MGLTTVGTTAVIVSGFSVVPPQQQLQKHKNNIRYNTELNGLFDGVKDAFQQPPSEVDSSRETPIDRWMGWSVVNDNEEKEAAPAAPSDFIDSMDEQNYIGVCLSKPMGIVFEENDSEYGGIFVQSLTEDGMAAKDGNIQSGDQLVPVRIGWRHLLKRVVSLPRLLLKRKHRKRMLYLLIILIPPKKDRCCFPVCFVSTYSIRKSLKK